MTTPARRWRSAIRQLATRSPLRPIAARLYDVLVTGELAVARGGSAARDDAALASQLTVLVKTFERPATLARLVTSIRRYYPTLPILVVDDSHAPQPLATPGVETIVLPFDRGVSAGRQAGLDRVRTPYVLLLDDDFVFYGGTDLAPALARLARQPRIDLLGGQLIDLPLVRFREPPLGKIFATAARPLEPIGSTIDGLLVCDKIANFYIARTARLRLVGWTPELRRLDHADFFTRALGKLVSVFDRDLRCLHAQTPFDEAYMVHRRDVVQDLAVLAARWPSV